MEPQWLRWVGLRGELSARQAARLIEDTRHHLRFVATSLWADEQAILDDYVCWSALHYACEGMPDEWLEIGLRGIADSLAEKLPADEAAAAREAIATALQRLAEAGGAAAGAPLPHEPLDELPAAYLAAALAGEQRRALEMLREAMRGGMDVRDVYGSVFAPVQREIGRLWLTNGLTVAEEHYITAIAQVAMAQLYEDVSPGEPMDRSVVVACVGGEMHELGARMVADFFEMEGWDSHYLGANTPAESIVHAIKQFSADVVALSATMSYHLVDLAEVIRAIRADAATREVPVLVGGHPFTLAPELWRRIGADGTARDARGAVALASQLVDLSRATH